MNKLTDKQEILFNDITSKLQQNTALKSLEGLTDIEAYRQGGGKSKSISSESQEAKRILNNPKVKAFIDSVRGEIINKSIMTREEALERLSSLARGDMSKLINFRTVETVGDEGEKVRQAVWDIPDSIDQCPDQLSTIAEVGASRDGIKIKQHDPKAAIKQLAEMEGWNAAHKVEHDLSKSTLDIAARLQIAKNASSE